MDKNSMEPEIEKREDSLKKRYFFKLSTNLVIFVLNILTAGIIPRGLGPIAYGNFSFLSDFFQKAFGFFDSGTSIAFYTKLSQRQKESGLVRFYWMFVITMICIVLLFVFAFSTTNADKLWPDQKIKYIWMALFWGVLTWLSNIFSKIVDAYALTSKGEIIKIFQKIFATSLLLVMFWLNKFSLTEFFVYHFIILLIIIIAWSILIRKSGYELFPKTKLKNSETKGYIKEFYNYSGPLIIYAFIALIVGIFDRLILQKFAGSIQQAYFGLSFKISSICLLFTTAMTPLILREFSIAFKSNNIASMRKMFIKYIPSLYVIATYFAVFIFFQADHLSLIIGGKNFVNSQIVIAIMALYPIHQTYGQLSGSIFFATGQTKLYRNIGIIFMTIGLFFIYFLLSPSENGFGMNMGAVGLAIKMVSLQFIGVNVLLWYNCKLMKLPFIKLFMHQLYTIVLFGLIAGASSMMSNFFVDNYLTSIFDKELSLSIWSFILGGIVYTILVFILIYMFPAITFHSRAGLANQYKQMKAIILKKASIRKKNID